MKNNVAILDSLNREGLLDKITLDYKSEHKDKEGHVEIFGRSFQAEGSANTKVLRRSILGFHDKEGEDQCVWITVSDGKRDFIHPFNKYNTYWVPTISWTVF